MSFKYFKTLYQKKKKNIICKYTFKQNKKGGLIMLLFVYYSMTQMQFEEAISNQYQFLTEKLFFLEEVNAISSCIEQKRNFFGGWLKLKTYPLRCHLAKGKYFG